MVFLTIKAVNTAQGLALGAEEEEALASEEPSGDAKLITAIRDPLKEATQPG